MGEALLERPIVRLGLAATVGVLLGAFVSFTVNCTLVEISINAFFSFYFGVLFILIGGLILWRTQTGDHPHPAMLRTFASLVVLSGVLCFFLEQNWFLHTHANWKVPMYGILGMSVCFGFLFPLIDLVNFFCAGTGPAARPLIESEKQVQLVAAAAVLMGVVFGLIFGLLDVEDARTPPLIKIQLLKAESICYPIGALIGGFAAALNQHYRDNQPHSYGFDHLHDDDLDEDY